MRTILIVDDDAGLQDLLQAVLEGEGYQVLVASDGQEALVQVSAHHPHLILLDLMMPHMNGSAFVAALEQRGLRASTTIIIVSADRHAVQLANQLHIDGLMQKPFEISELLDMVARLVGA
jgi:CheY-like chemotaxis protein